jgi:DNA polymerase-1
VQFHEEDYKLSEKNIPALTEIFNLLEFKTLGKRILGSDFEVVVAQDPEVQTDLFGNEVKTKKPLVKTKTIVLNSEEGTQSVLEPNDEPGNQGYEADEEEASDLPKLIANKNITNTPHQYETILGDKAI